MRWFPKLSIVVLCLALAGGAAAAKKDEKKDPKSKEAAKKKGKGPPSSAATPAPATGQKKRIELPLVAGHASKGLRIPLYDALGKLKTVMHIDVALPIDKDRVDMTGARVESFKEDGTFEYGMELPRCVLNVETNVVTSNTQTTIKRDDFILTGDTIEFNTETRDGKLVGHVKMTIFDLKSEMGDREKVPTVELKPNE